MAFNLIQTPGTFALANSTALSQAFVSNNTAGNLLIAMIHVATPGANASSVTDTAGNTWQPIGLSDIGIAQIWYCASAIGGANTVTAHFASAANGGISVAEYSGHFAAHPVSTAITPNGSFNPAASIYTPVADSLILGLFTDNGAGSTWTIFSGITIQTPGVSVSAIWGDNTSSSAGLNAISGTQAPITDFIAKVVSFLPASYTPPATPALVTKTEGAAATNGAIKGAASPATDVFPGGNQSGNTIVVAVEQAGTTDRVTGVADTAGNAYTLQAGGVNQADSNNHIWYSYWTAPVTHPGLVNNKVTVTLSSGSAQIAGMEFSGAQVTQDSTAHGNASYTLTAAAANELIVSSHGYSGGGTNWSGLDGADLFGVTAAIMEVNYRLSTLGSNTITATISSGFSGGLSLALLQSYQISGNAGIGGATISYSGTTSGSVIANGSGNYMIPGLSNGNYTITPSLFGYVFSPVSQNETISGSGITGVNFTASPIVGAYSQPDCRIFGNFPNASRNVQGTLTYDVQTSSNPAIPSTDSRVSKPVDSRIAAIIPENSRTPGIFGPGQN